MNVSWKLAGVVTLAICLVVGLETAWSVSRAMNELTDEFETELRAQAQLLGLAAAEIWRREGAANARRVVESLDESLHLRQVRWLEAADGPPPDFPGDSDAWAGVLAGEPVAVRDTARDRVVVFASVHTDDRPTAVLSVERGMNELLSERGAVVRRRAFFAAVQVFLVGVLVVLAARLLVGRPLEALSAHARRVGAGDLSGRLTFQRQDEIGRLAADMNDMTGRLEKARYAIAEQARQRVLALEELRHAERLKTVGQLASGVAHELGTPLNVVAGRAQMIAKGQVTGDGAVECANIIVDQAKRMTQLIRHVLTFARRRPAPRGPLDLMRVIDEALSLLEPTLKKARVVTEVEPPDQRFMVRGDPGQLEQVLANILMNAVHAMPKGGAVHLQAEEVEARHPEQDEPGTFVRLNIRDTGQGMPPEVASRVFEPFFTTKQVNEGTGLGLSVAYGIVRDHGGWIAVHSVQGEGTTFSVHVPRYDEEVLAMGPAPDAAPATHA